MDENNLLNSILFGTTSTTNAAVEVAKVLHEVYLAFIAHGFTKDQAFELVKSMLVSVISGISKEKFSE